MTEHLQKAVYVAVKNYIINDLGFSKEELRNMIREYTDSVVQKIVKEKETYIQDLIDTTIHNRISKVNEILNWESITTLKKLLTKLRKSLMKRLLLN